MEAEADAGASMVVYIRGPPGHKHDESSRWMRNLRAEPVQYIFSRPQNPAPVWPVMGDFGGCMDLGPTGGDFM